ncbi:MAG: hypothetical protein WBK77_07355 [Alphaproteobacteria bacterium]
MPSISNTARSLGHSLKIGEIYQIDTQGATLIQNEEPDKVFRLLQGLAKEHSDTVFAGKGQWPDGKIRLGFIASATNGMVRTLANAAHELGVGSIVVNRSNRNSGIAGMILDVT